MEAAAQEYFNKSASDVSLIEGAALAGILREPASMEGSLDETRNQTQLDKLQRRTDAVLVNMAEAGLRSQEEIDQARAELAQNTIYAYVKPYEKPVQEQSGEKERDRQSERVDGKQEHPAGQIAIGGGQSQHRPQNRSDARGPPCPERHPHQC